MSDRRSAAIHEAGHAVMACRLKIRFRCITIIPEVAEDNNGGGVIDALHTVHALVGFDSSSLSDLSREREEQAFNAQATVAAGSLLVVAADVVQATNDKQQIVPMLEQFDLSACSDRPAAPLQPRDTPNG